MTEKKFVSPLMAEDNVLMVEVTPAEERGLSAENAYRHLAGLPLEPVEVEEEE